MTIDDYWSLADVVAPDRDDLLGLGLGGQHTAADLVRVMVVEPFPGANDLPPELGKVAGPWVAEHPVLEARPEVIVQGGEVRGSHWVDVHGPLSPLHHFRVPHRLLGPNLGEP